MIPPKADAAHVISAADALERLRAGNRAHLSNVQGISTCIDSARRSELVSVQEPFAIVLGCADSRVPAEIIFNQGPGDLFVVRVAGNIRSSVVNLRHGSQILEQLIQHDGLRVVGAEYSLEMDTVDFYEDLAEEKA